MNFDRARSFMERFVVERAGTFRREYFDEDMYTAILDAKRCYRLIATHAQDAEVLPDGNNAGVSANQQSPVPHGAPPSRLQQHHLDALRQLSPQKQDEIARLEHKNPGFIERMFNSMHTRW